MSALKNVILVGVSYIPVVSRCFLLISVKKKNISNTLPTFQAAGNLGPSILEALQSSSDFNVSILTREGSSSSITPPRGVQIITADYSSHSDLVTAFTGQDAVVSAVGFEGVPGQIKLIDAAIEAGVQRFIPSEFGSDSTFPKVSLLSIFKPKITIREYLEKKGTEGKITWTAIATGPFFDWGVSSLHFSFCVPALRTN